jgi:hypothetical protein
MIRSKRYDASCLGLSGEEQRQPGTIMGVIS